MGPCGVSEIDVLRVGKRRKKKGEKKEEGMKNLKGGRKL